MEKPFTLNSEQLRYEDFDSVRDEVLRDLLESRYDQIIQKLSKIGSKHYHQDESVEIYNRFKMIKVYDTSVSKKYNIPYVHASFVDRFVTCQEPLPKDHSIFQHFIFKSDISLIISLKEDLHYFDKNQLIELIEENEVFKVEKFLIEQKEVVRVMCYIWEDDNIITPDQMDQLYSYISKNFAAFYQKYTTLVHCKAGVGRTGTFLMYSLLFEMSNSGTKITPEIFVDVFLNMRKSRNHLVYNQKQLKFLVDCFLLK
ncbi:Ptpn3 [Nucleospora cyclopteri]